MRIFAVDTSSSVASCALIDGDKLVCEEVLNNKLTHSQTLMPMIESVLKKSEMTALDIDRFAVVTGPGSFTGLRIGVSAVKALAHAVDKECVGVSTLEAMAYNLPFQGTLVCPIMDARRGEVYNGIYRFEEGLAFEVRKMRALPIDELLDDVLQLGEKTIFLGDAVPVFKEKIVDVLGNMALFAPANLNAQRASSVAVLAKNKDAVKYDKLSPIYLRKSQAEREKEERERKQ